MSRRTRYFECLECGRVDYTIDAYSDHLITDHGLTDDRSLEYYGDKWLFVGRGDPGLVPYSPPP